MTPFFQLKPYVSFRTDAAIEKKDYAYSEALRKHERLASNPDTSSKALSDSKAKLDHLHWPPPPLTSKLLFDVHYRNDVIRNFRGGKYSGSSSVLQDKKNK